MDGAHYHRIRHQLAIVDAEVPDFLGIRNGLYLSEGKNGSNGNVVYFEDGILKTVSKNGVATALPQKFMVSGDLIALGSLPSSLTGSPGTILIGDHSGEGLIGGSDNIFMGRYVGREFTEGNECIAFGPESLRTSSAVGNSIAIGAGSMGKCGKTEMNIGIGKDTLTKINDSYNIAMGIGAGKELTGPFINHIVAMGREAMAFARDSVINVIGMGRQACSALSGNNFQSVYIGDRVAQNLSSSVISINNIGIGSEVLSQASNVSDIVCIGSLAGQNVSGVRSLIFGARTANNITGSLNDDIIMGTEAGSRRTYSDSKVILLGHSAGKEGQGANSVILGNSAGQNAFGNDLLAWGKSAGEYATGDSIIALGAFAGSSASGSTNVYIGSKAGQGVLGSNNIWIGEGGSIGDQLDKSVVIGSQIFVKGSEAVVIGSQVGRSSVGFLKRDILIGANAGMGQHYNNSPSENKGMLLIGANAGMGDPDNPQAVNSSDLVCIGHSAGHSREQVFHKSVILGNYAGSFAGKAVESVVVGHSAGVGMDGEMNVYLGPHAGFNVKGNRNILIGPHCGDRAGSLDPELDATLAIGNAQRPTVLGDLDNGNLLVGATGIVNKWTNAKGSVGFLSIDAPDQVDPGISGVLYGTGKHLGYSTSTRSTLLTFPYKFLSNGEMNGLTYVLNTSVDGSTLLHLRAVPSAKTYLLLNEEVMLTVTNGVPTVSALKNPKWRLEVGVPSDPQQPPSLLRLVCAEDVKGICYIEAIGVHVLSVQKK